MSHRSPTQLWISGQHPRDDSDAMSNTSLSLISYMYNYVHTQAMGIDWNGPLLTPGENIVCVEPPFQYLNHLDYVDLCANVHPLDPNSEYGIELYAETLSFVMNKV